MGLEIESTNYGAELLSVKLNGLEKIHQGAKVLDNSGEMYWKRHSSVLFPIVGRLKDNKCVINKKEYIIEQHGFARDMEFEELEKNNIYHSYVLRNNEYIKRQYPYKFELYVSYLVNDNTLMVKYKVVNKDKKEMLFGIGGQPAFICNVSSENYYIEFEKEENDVEIMRNQRGTLIDGSSVINKDIIQDNKIINLDKNTFEFDAIVLENLKSNRVYLKSKEADREILSVKFNKFPYLTIWSKPNSPFIAISPSYTVSDRKETLKELDKKENIIHLKPKEDFECSYYITFK